ncbi:MAG TPA: hypothetical protein VGS57_05370 [Thermoanaerobaculia bacterium]|jgi:hypothetical protein|nr:hypothetical protein [Thermoanaerobaculia bacterium]
MKRTTFALLAALALAAAPGAAEICTIDDVPAATLLLPYFEVSLDAPVGWGKHTLFSINNASDVAAVAHVTLWTDESIPTLDFDVYLTGYDVQTINLYDIFAYGNLPRTADDGADPTDLISPQGALSQDINFPGSSGPCVAAYTNPVLDATRLANLRAAHTGKNAPAYGGCLGANYGDNIARGYVTIDSVTQCNLLFPSSATYFSGGIADNRNILWGDYFYVNEMQNLAAGETLVHVESCGIGLLPPKGVVGGAGNCPFVPGDYTFYGRYASVAGQDQREPLSTTFATRYINGGLFDGGTDLVVWRDSKTIPTGANGPHSCATTPSWFPLNQTDVVAFDETENPTDLCFTGDVISPPLGGAETCFPLETQRVHLSGGNVIGSDPTPPAAFGWIYLNLNSAVAGVSYPAADPSIMQNWVTTLMDAEGRFGVGFDAIQLDSACAPRNVIFIGN